MPGRSYNLGSNYRYGFNGKENDNDVKGEGNSIDYGLRTYDPRLGRFLSTDPLGKKFPFLTPYQYASNSPIAFVDLDGAEANYASFKMMAESIEAEAALYKGNTKDMPFRLQSQLFMLGMAKSASVEGLMYEIDKDLQATFSNLPSINFNELPPTVQQDLMQHTLDRNSPFGLVAATKGIGNMIIEAANGNPEALGNIAGVIVAARMFKMPESELNSTASGKFLQNAKNVTGSTDEVLKQMGDGVTDFKMLDEVIVSNRPRKIMLPSGWITKGSKKGGGTVFQDPNNPHNSIRQMPGNSNSPNTSQQNPYVIFKKDGVSYDVNGQPLKNATDPGAHIPLDKFDMEKMPKFK